MNREELKKEAQEQVNYCTPLYPESFIQGYLAGAEPRENKIADIKATCDLAIEGRDVKIYELEQQIEKMKCCYNCKSFKGYGETCEGWGEPVLNPNCDCTEWELKEIEK